jgi:hypothetical protein
MSRAPSRASQYQVGDPMMRVRGTVVRSRRRSALAALALLAAEAAFSAAPAQDAGVSGIPPGPANARGLNGSINDPSGLGNAAKFPALPGPNLNPVPVPRVDNPIAPIGRVNPATVAPSAYPELVPLARAGRERHEPRRHTPAKTPREQASARDRSRPLGDHVPNICRGC